MNLNQYIVLKTICQITYKKVECNENGRRKINTGDYFSKLKNLTNDDINGVFVDCNSVAINLHDVSQCYFSNKGLTLYNLGCEYLVLTTLDHNILSIEYLFNYLIFYKSYFQNKTISQISKLEIYVPSLKNQQQIITNINNLNLQYVKLFEELQNIKNKLSSSDFFETMLCELSKNDSIN